MESCKAVIKKWIRDRNCGNTQGTLSLSRFYGTEYPIFLKMESISASPSTDSGRSYFGHTMSTSSSQPLAHSASRNLTSSRIRGIASQLSPVHGQTNRLTLSGPAMQLASTKSSSPRAPSFARPLDTSTYNACPPSMPQMHANWTTEAVPDGGQLVNNSNYAFLPQSSSVLQYSSRPMASPLPTTHGFYSQPEPSSVQYAGASPWNIASDGWNDF